MVETQIIKKNNKPIAVVIDFEQYLKYKAMEEDQGDYKSAIEVKKKNKIWHNNKNVKKELKLE
jgi:hypothetical protein